MINRPLKAAVFFLLTILCACEYVDPRYFNEGSEVQVSDWVIDSSFLISNESQDQMVLLEEYTGQNCGNCPAAARRALKLDSFYKERLHVMAIHAGYFAEPQNNPNGNDFRCAAGDFLDNKFKVSETIPKGLINRGRFGGSRVALLGPTAWDGRLNEMFNRPDPAFKFFLHPFFNQEKQQFYAVSHIKFLGEVSDSIEVSLYLVEDSIVNWQLDYGASVPQVSNYVHRHVLREAFTPVGGSESAGTPPFSAGKISSGRWVQNRRPEIVRKNCKVIAIAYKASNDEILQVVEEDIVDR